MNITLQLFGRFRELDRKPDLSLEFPDIATAGEFRAAMTAWAQAHWPEDAVSLLKVSAIATDNTLLSADSPLPDDGRLALLPPVSGG